MIHTSEPDTFYCNAYSFGVVFYELITSQLPYAHMQGRDMVSVELNFQYTNFILCVHKRK